MIKTLIGTLLSMASACAFAQGLEPGEWQFSTTLKVPGAPKPQTALSTQCVTKEDADPDRWMRKHAPQGDCKLTTARKSGDTFTMEVTCPKSSMRGHGTTRMGRGTMESEMALSGEQQGRKVEMYTRTTGKRLGPCKS
jgi:hypothetical protein